MANTSGIAGWDRASDDPGPAVRNEGEGKAAPAHPADVASIDGVMAALYACISGPEGVPRDWARNSSLFSDGAVIAPPTSFGDPSSESPLFDVEGYRRDRAPFFQRHGFFEMEIARRTERYGCVAQVFSTYESRRHLDEPPFMRGINSVQLVWRRHRWWILSIAWQHESADLPLPERHLQPLGAGDAGA